MVAVEHAFGIGVKFVRDGQKDKTLCGNICFAVYILANERNTVVYAGVTGRLAGRVWEHKHKVVKGFTKKYNVTKLVWYETTEDRFTAIVREPRTTIGAG